MMGISMNTALDGSARVDSTKGLPLGEVRELTKLVKITEDVRKYAAEQEISENEVLEKGLKESQQSLSKKTR